MLPGVTRSYRQAALLMREVRNFQEAHGLQDWPCLVAGGECKIHVSSCALHNDSQISILPPSIPHTLLWLVEI